MFLKCPTFRGALERNFLVGVTFAQSNIHAMHVQACLTPGLYTSVNHELAVWVTYVLCAGPVLALCCRCAGCVLALCWLCAGRVLALCRLCAGCAGSVLLVCWRVLACVGLCWLRAGSVLALCWFFVGSVKILCCP